MKTAFFPVLLVAAMAAVVLPGCGGASAPKPEPTPAAAPKAALTVSTVAVVAKTEPQALKVSGNVLPWQEAVIGLEVGGHRIQRVLVNVGDKVKKGQVLATLNPEALQTDLLAANATVSDVQAALAQAQVTLSRAQRLSVAGGVSEQELSQHLTAVQSAQAKLAVAQAQVANAKLKLGFATLRAPDDGVISSRTAAEGAIAPAGTELFRLIRKSKLEWRAEVPADQLHLVKVGSAARVSAPDGSVLPGTVRQVAPSVDLSTRNGFVYVDVPRAGVLKAGMHLAGELLGAPRSLAVLPLSAVSTRDGRSYVFTVKDSIAQAVEVQLGSSDAVSVQVLAGVAPGARVVSQGAGFLKDGDRVAEVATPGAQ